MTRKIYLTIFITILFCFKQRVYAFNIFSTINKKQLENLKNIKVSNYNCSAFLSLEKPKPTEHDFYDFVFGVNIGYNIIKYGPQSHLVLLREGDEYKETQIKRGYFLVNLETGFMISYKEFFSKKIDSFWTIPFKIKCFLPHDIYNLSILIFTGINIKYLLEERLFLRRKEKLKKLNFDFVLGVGFKTDSGIELGFSGTIPFEKNRENNYSVTISFDLFQIYNFLTYKPTIRYP